MVTATEVYVVERHDDMYEGPHSMRIASDVQTAVGIGFDMLANVRGYSGGWELDTEATDRFDIWAVGTSGSVRVFRKTLE